MLTLEEVPVDSHERVVRVLDGDVGLHGYIAIHSLSRGPSLGGLRMYDYVSPDRGLDDVLLLSEAMTYKSAAAGLPFGGGKAVIVGDPSEIKTVSLLEQFGRAVDQLDGAYITAEDVGTTVSDLAVVANATEWVAGLPEELGGSGDPSPATAIGLIAAMRAVSDHLWDSPDLAGRSVLVQGAGKVGIHLLDHLAEAGASLFVADVDRGGLEAATDRYPSITVVPPGTCLDSDVDIASPCALGGVLNPRSVETMGCTAIVGSANNQLSSPEVAATLRERDITYAPDFIVNAGGIINIASEYTYTSDDVDAALQRIGDTVSSILTHAERTGMTTHDAAMAIARSRLED